MMLKKIALISSILLVSACTTNPKGVSSEQFATTSKLTKGYNFTEITGERIFPINLTEKSGLVVMKADSVLSLRIGEKQSSTLLLNLQFIDNQQKYNFVNVNGVSQRTKQRKKTVRQCDDQCSITQYMVLNIETDALIEAREQGLIFSVNRAETSTDFIFKLPSNYIDGLLKRYEAEGVVPVTIAATSTVIEESKATEMSQYWFNKLDSEEQILFSTWSIKNTKQESDLQEGTKSLEKLHYWYQEANTQEQKAIRIWAIENMK